VQEAVLKAQRSAESTESVSSALWAGDVTDIFLSQTESKVDGLISTSIEYAEWKTEKIAHERELQYNHETAKGSGQPNKINLLKNIPNLWLIWALEVHFGHQK
jgi:hypothetical protein